MGRCGEVALLLLNTTLAQWFSVEEMRYFCLHPVEENLTISGEPFVIGRMQSYFTGTFDNFGCLKMRCGELGTDLPVRKTQGNRMF